MPGLANLSQYSNRERWAVLESWEIFPFLNNFTHGEHCLTAPQPHPPKGCPRPRDCVIPVNYCMEDDLGTQVSPNRRQPDLVFFKNVLTRLFSFLYSVAANKAMKDEVKPWQLMQLHLPLPALLPIPHASPMLSCNGGRRICRRRDQWMDSGGGNKCSMFISPGSTLSCAKPTQPTQPNSGRMRDPKVHGF